jgi:hypothetical protein
MNYAVLIALADAAVVALNGATLSLPVLASRKYVPVFKLEELGTVEVVIVPSDISFELASRVPTHTFDYTIDIGFRGKISAAVEPAPAEVDPLMLLVEEVVDYFRKQPLTVATGLETLTLRCTEGQNRPIYDANELDVRRDFGSLISLTFRTVR